MGKLEVLIKANEEKVGVAKLRIGISLALASSAAFVIALGPFPKSLQCLLNLIRAN